jgi:hypothetical protein
MSNIIHHFNGGLYTKEMHLDAGDTIIKHTHDYDTSPFWFKARSCYQLVGSSKF